MGLTKRLTMVALILAVASPGFANGKGKRKGTNKPAKRQTKALTLDNGMKVVLVSDPDTDRSAAALSVNVGSMNDGAYPGIAHFLEHMLFLGTKKYPKTGDYKDYLAANSGSSNAYTAYDHTNYFFEVKNEAFEGALDRFSRFFIDPLFTDDLAEREVNAVDSEHSKNLEDEYWRARQVYRSLLNPKHPHCNFATGSKQTLSGVKNQTLVNFYKKHYSSNIMNLVVFSNQPIKVLESWTRAKFAEVPNNKGKALKTPEPLFYKGIAGHYVQIKTIRDIRQLWLKFEVPGSTFGYSHKANSFVGYVLGHEGRESVLQQLKKEGLATSLSAGGRQLGHQGTFNITVTLTPKGLSNARTVVERIFAMINELKSKADFPDYLIDEQRKMAAINFRFRQVGSASNEAYSMAAAMISTPHENLLENMFLVKKPSKLEIRKVLGAMTPDNMVLMVLAKERKTDKVEPHYKTEYRVGKISDSFKSALAKARPVGDMGLPAPNAFIPSSFKLIQKDIKKPYVYDTAFGQVWLRNDTKFNQPKAALQILVQNDNADSVRNFVLGQMFAAAVSEALNPYTYPMNQAGVSFSVGSDRPGIVISAGGYSHKLPELLEFAVPFLKECRIDEKRFETIKNQMLRGLKNRSRQPAQGHAVELFRQLLREVHFTTEEMLPVVEKATFRDLKQYFRRYRRVIHLQGFVYGSMSRKSVRKLTDNLIKNLRPSRALPMGNRYQGRVIKLKPGTSVRLRKEVKSNDSCTLLVYQGDKLNGERKAALNVLAQVMPSRFYGDLRTLQQTGYIVGAFCFDVEELPMFGFLAQSSGYSTDSLRGRFESFIKHLPGELEKEVKAKDFKKFKAAAIAGVTRKRKTFAAELGFYFNATFVTGDEKLQEKQVKALKKLSRKKFLAIVKEFFNESKVRRVSVEVVGSDARHRFKTTTLAELKKGAKYHSRPQIVHNSKANERKREPLNVLEKIRKKREEEARKKREAAKKGKKGKKKARLY